MPNFTASAADVCVYFPSPKSKAIRKYNPGAYKVYITLILFNPSVCSAVQCMWLVHYVTSHSHVFHLTKLFTKYTHKHIMTNWMEVWEWTEIEVGTPASTTMSSFMAGKMTRRMQKTYKLKHTLLRYSKRQQQPQHQQWQRKWISYEKYLACGVFTQAIHG